MGTHRNIGTCILMRYFYKNLFKSGLILLVGFASGVAFVNSFYRVSPQERKEALFDVAVDGVLLLIFKSETTSLVAHRKNETDGFFVHVIKSGKSQQCHVGAHLGGYLEQMSNLRSVRTIDGENLKIDFPQYLGKLEIRDQMVELDTEPIYFFASSDGEKIAAKHAGVSGEVGISKDVFRALEAGCPKLAG